MDEREALLIELPEAPASAASDPLDGGTPRIRTIDCDADPTLGGVGGAGHSDADHGRGDGVTLDDDRRRDPARRCCFDAVVDALRGADADLLLGPGATRDAFERRYAALPGTAQRPPIVESEACDRIAPSQLAARVAEVFARHPSRVVDAGAR